MLENQRPEQVLAALLETAGDAILGIALDGSIFLWSQGAEHLYGYTTAELAGRSLTREAALPRDGSGGKVRRRRIRRGADQFRPAHGRDCSWMS
jgi:PAS domain S-box-containing protein